MSEKIKMYNQSGKPTDFEAATKWEQEFKESYDALWEKVAAKEITMEKMKESLDVVDKELKEKHKMHKEIKLPTNIAEWTELMHAVQAPLTVAITEETKELSIFVMDSEY